MITIFVPYLGQEKLCERLLAEVKGKEKVLLCFLFIANNGRGKGEKNAEEIIKAN